MISLRSVSLLGLCSLIKTFLSEITSIVVLARCENIGICIKPKLECSTKFGGEDVNRGL